MLMRNFSVLQQRQEEIELDIGISGGGGESRVCWVTGCFRALLNHFGTFSRQGIWSKQEWCGRGQPG